MGNLVSSRSMEKTEKYRVVISGLFGAGKTSFVYKMKQGEVLPTTPSLGLGIESVRLNDTSYAVWDVGSGRCMIRPLLKYHSENTHAIVMVIDSNDKDRFQEAMEEQCDRISDGGEGMEGVPVLVLAHKQDLPDAMSPNSIGAHIVEKGYLRKHPWCVFGSSVVSREGQAELDRGLEWLGRQVTQYTRQQMYNMHVAKYNKVTKNQVMVNKADSNDNADRGTDKPKASYYANVVLTLKRWLKT